MCHDFGRLVKSTKLKRNRQLLYWTDSVQKRFSRPFSVYVYSRDSNWGWNVLRQGTFGNVHRKFLVSPLPRGGGGQGVLLASDGWRLGMLPNILEWMYRPVPQWRIIQPPMSTTANLKNPPLYEKLILHPSYFIDFIDLLIDRVEGYWELSGFLQITAFQITKQIR